MTQSDPPFPDQPVRYIDKTHAWYGALGYENPYGYARHDDAPFTRPAKPLAESRVLLLTSAAPYRPELGDQSASAPTNAAAKFYQIYTGETGRDHDLRVSHIAVDRAEMQDDANCWFPLPALRRAAASGRIGGLTRHFLGIPTNRSQRHTIAVDAPEVLRLARAEAADVAILVPNCPICHQSMSLISRHLEQAGIATVVMGTAKDIVELCGVARLLFSDMPLGNAAGRPLDPAGQDATLELALKLLEDAPAPRTTLHNPLRWTGRPDWKQRYLSLDRLTPDDLARLRAQNDGGKAIASALRAATIGADDIT
jgi:hypothetical protein